MCIFNISILKEEMIRKAREDIGIEIESDNLNMVNLG